MEDTGCSREELLSFLTGCRAEDLHHDHILSSMCTIPHSIAVAVHEMFSATNLGDPGLFPGTVRVENLLVHALGELMHLPSAGGTESNLQDDSDHKEAKTGQYSKHCSSGVGVLFI